MACAFLVNLSTQSFIGFQKPVNDVILSPEFILPAFADSNRIIIDIYFLSGRTCSTKLVIY